MPTRDTDEGRPSSPSETGTAQIAGPEYDPQRDTAPADGRIGGVPSDSLQTPAPDDGRASGPMTASRSHSLGEATARHRARETPGTRPLRASTPLRRRRPRPGDSDSATARRQPGAIAFGTPNRNRNRSRRRRCAIPPAACIVTHSARPRNPGRVLWDMFVRSVTVFRTVKSCTVTSPERSLVSVEPSQRSLTGSSSHRASSGSRSWL
jgi:hypothetical protein